jgi:hypothetical protein
MLVAPLKVEVSGPLEVLPGFQNRDVAAPRIEPDVHDIRFLAEVLAPAFGTDIQVAKELLR